MVSDSSGNAPSSSVPAELYAIEHIGDIYFEFFETWNCAAGTYVLTVDGDAFAAQQVQFTITPHDRQ
jgi:hypothetical protein